ncbi:hypothetical protein EIP91_003711 [Steccherinum ochraceum]|uniref:F-box domain-containing protein n=1 Tax=Steccherinum ochraceum TaxID=92696 RepID=A0A4R0RWR7_9APHY|nr:hypothetical protein EIP91_003711 [Steccherinum ochraceum]
MELFSQLSILDALKHPRLPQELTDIIIDHFHDDKKALSLCSLVSRDWLWSARYHLFYKTVITTRNAKYGLDAFLKTAAASPFSLGEQVRCLHVVGAHDKAQDDFASILKFIGAVLPQIPSIRRIDLSSMVWGQTSLLDVGTAAPMPWELGMLTLKDIRLEASDAESLEVAQQHLFSLFQQFSAIRLLTIDTVRIGYRALYYSALPLDPTTTAAIVDTPSLTRCHIAALNCYTEDDSFYLLAALSRLGFARNLQTLKFGSGCPEITASAQVVTDLAAASLRFVRYRVPSDDYAHLRGYVSSQVEAQTVLTQMINTITCAPADTMAIILEFFVRPQDFEVLYESAGQGRWALLDQQLSRRAELRRVVVVLRSSQAPSADSAERFKEMLPAVHEKGRLLRTVGNVSETMQWDMLTGL